MTHSDDSSMHDRPEGAASPALLRAEVVVPCAPLGDAVTFFTQRLGFRLLTISPADDPAVATLEGHGVRLRLDRHAEGPPVTLRLCTDTPPADAPTEAPGGMRLEWHPRLAPVEIPPAAQTTVYSEDATQWIEGRAGMRYRDLIPGRLNEALIASHIRIDQGGPVPDHVHFHRIYAQVIYCHRGWVRVVYEDQGAPFVLRPGDCVLQPPEIRHRVLESSDGLEVIELGAPAVHETHIDHALSLPTPTLQPTRRFSGQRFVHHQAEQARLHSSNDGTRWRDLELTDASAGRVSGRVRQYSAGQRREEALGADASVRCILDGSVELAGDGDVRRLHAGASVTLPHGAEASWSALSSTTVLEFEVMGLIAR